MSESLTSPPSLLTQIEDLLTRIDTQYAQLSDDKTIAHRWAVRRLSDGSTIQISESQKGSAAPQFSMLHRAVTDHGQDEIWKQYDLNKGLCSTFKQPVATRYSSAVHVTHMPRPISDREWFNLMNVVDRFPYLEETDNQA